MSRDRFERGGIDLQPVAAEFIPGHRLGVEHPRRRLEVAASLLEEAKRPLGVGELVGDHAFVAEPHGHGRSLALFEAGMEGVLADDSDGGGLAGQGERAVMAVGDQEIGPDLIAVIDPDGVPQSQEPHPLAAADGASGFDLDRA